MRWFTPLVFLTVAIYVQHHNGQSGGTIIAFPFLETIFPSLEGDLDGLGQATVGTLYAVATLTGVYAFRNWWSTRKNKARLG